MRSTVPLLLLCLAAVNAAQPDFHPQAQDNAVSILSTSQTPSTHTSALEKRRGGGRGGGGGGRSGGGSGSGSSSSTTGSGFRSITGGRTVSGSGTKPLSKSNVYPGGSSVPYTSGRSSSTGIVPTLVSLSVISVLFSGAWLYASVYAYHFSAVHYRDADTHRNESAPVTCLCQMYAVCGCDENANQTYVEEVLAGGNGSGVYRFAEVDGVKTLLVNGTLDNGTTAPGGTENGAGGGAGPALGMVLLVAGVVGGVFGL